VHVEHLHQFIMLMLSIRVSSLCICWARFDGTFSSIKFLSLCWVCGYPIWLAVLNRGYRAFKVVWLGMANRTLYDELPGGIVLCSPPGSELGNKMTVHNKTRCYLFLLEVSSLSTMHIVSELCQILDWKKGFINDQQQGFVTKWIM
jgi:hypothetical protein